MAAGPRTQDASPVGTVPRPRIQSLSDLIFGLALSIGALTLIGRQPTSTQDLGLTIGLYGLSFLILISVWRLYSATTSALPAEGIFLVDLNIVLLFFVSIEPYLFNELFATSGSVYTMVSGVYSIDLAAMFLILGFFTNSLVDEEKRLIPKELLRRWRFERNVTLLVALIFILSLAPYLGDTSVFLASTPSYSYSITLRSLVWILALVAGWAGRTVASTIGPGKTGVPQPDSALGGQNADP